MKGALKMFAKFDEKAITGGKKVTAKEMKAKNKAHTLLLTKVEPANTPTELLGFPTTNLMPDLAPWDYEHLKASIARVGVLVPVLKDEYGNTIDGYQRERACRELAITDYRIETVAGLSEDEKRDRAFTLNLVRRRLDQKQMRELIAAELKRTPDLSDNWLAQILGSTDKTVEAVRPDLIVNQNQILPDEVKTALGVLVAASLSLSGEQQKELRAWLVQFLELWVGEE
jgi:ParB-like chromosome segregation protein Spo0J